MRQHRRTTAAVNLSHAIIKRRIAAQKCLGNGRFQKQAQHVPAIGGELCRRDEQHVRNLRQRRARVVIGHGNGIKAACCGLGSKLRNRARTVGGRERMDMQIGANDHGFLLPAKS